MILEITIMAKLSNDIILILYFLLFFLVMAISILNYRWMSQIIEVSEELSILIKQFFIKKLN